MADFSNSLMLFIHFFPALAPSTRVNKCSKSSGLRSLRNVNPAWGVRTLGSSVPLLLYSLVFFCFVCSSFQHEHACWFWRWFLGSASYSCRRVHDSSSPSDPVPAIGYWDASAARGCTVASCRFRIGSHPFPRILQPQKHCNIPALSHCHLYPTKISSKFYGDVKLRAVASELWVMITHGHRVT